jgi:hypothetical protein
VTAITDSHPLAVNTYFSSSGDDSNLRWRFAMKLRLASLSLLALCLTLAAVPAIAQIVYDNGPINGNTDAWVINFGFVVSDTFNVTNNNTTITGASFGMWLLPYDTLTSAELSITSSENGGTSYFDQTLNFTTGPCTVNTYGYHVCQEDTTFGGPTINIGTYWLNMQNATVPSGEPVYWDENSGPSSASTTEEIGTIPSESFTVLGATSITTTSTSTSTTSTSTSTTSSTGGGSVPEPGSIVLFASGVLSVVAVLRRKLF